MPITHLTCIRGSGASEGYHVFEAKPEMGFQSSLQVIFGLETIQGVK